MLESNLQQAMTALEHNRIVQIEMATIGSVYPRMIGRNSFRGSHGNGGKHQVVVLTTNTGKTGWGPALGILGDAQRFVGRAVSDLIDPNRGVVEDATAIDYALHDLAGNILDLPVYEMLGNAGKKVLPVYTGGIYFDDLDPAEAPEGMAAIRRTLDQDASLGFRDFKLKLGRGYRWMPHAEGLARDIEVTRLTREKFPDARILVDPNDGYSVGDIAEYLSAVADVGLYWIEEPFAERREDFVELRRLISELSPKTLIADGEYRPNFASVHALAVEGLIDVMLMDVLDFGLTAWRHVMPRVNETKANISPHAWGWPLKMLYAAQIGAGLGRAEIIEGVPGTIFGVDASAYTFEDGMLSVPERPGFGLTLKPEVQG